MAFLYLQFMPINNFKGYCQIFIHYDKLLVMMDSGLSDSRSDIDINNSESSSSAPVEDQLSSL